MCHTCFCKNVVFARDMFANDSLREKRLLQLFSNKFARNALADYVFLLYIDCKKYFTSALAINIYVGNIFGWNYFCVVTTAQ